MCLQPLVRGYCWRGVGNHSGKRHFEIAVIAPGVHPTNMDDVDFYEQNLYSTEDAERLPCSARAIIYCPMILGGLIALQVKAHATGEIPAREILFDLPSLKLIA